MVTPNAVPAACGPDTLTWKLLSTVSVVVTRRSYWPLATVVVSQLAWYGLVGSAGPRLENAPPCGASWNCAAATPEPASVESEVTVTVPPTVPADGAVIDPVGGAVSTVNVALA